MNSAYNSTGARKRDEPEGALRNKAFAYNSAAGSRNKPRLEKTTSAQVAGGEGKHIFGSRVGSVSDAYGGAVQGLSRNNGGSLSDLKQLTADAFGTKRGSFLKQPTASYTQMEAGHVS